MGRNRRWWNLGGAMVACGLAYPTSLRAESASVTVHVTATVGPSMTEVEVDGGWVRWSVIHGSPEDVAGSVRFELPDGARVTGELFPADAWAELWTDEGPSRLVLEGPPVERVVSLVALR